MTTLATLSLPTVPSPPATVQVCDGAVGCWATVTANGAPLATGGVNAKLPLPAIESVSPSLVNMSPLPTRPITVPLIVNARVLHVITMSIVSCAAVPAPASTVQVWLGFTPNKYDVKSAIVSAKNLDLTYGALFSQRLLLAIVARGATRDDAYRITQALAQEALDTHVHLRELLAADTLGAELDLDALFDFTPYVRYADTIVDRLDEIT